MKNALGNVCINWIDKHELKPEINFDKVKERFFTKSAKTHLMTDIQLTKRMS
jgi:hypothetical protein